MTEEFTPFDELLAAQTTLSDAVDTLLVAQSALADATVALGERTGEL